MSPISLLTLAILAAAAIVHAAESSSWLPLNFTRMRWHDSIVIGSKLYVDAGEVHNKTDRNLNAYTQRSTLAFPLDRAWTPRTLSPVNWSNKPLVYPFARTPSFWYNPIANTLSAYGGWQYGATCPNGHFQTWEPDGTINTIHCTKIPPQDQWSVMFKDNAGFLGSWRLLKPQPPSNIPPAQFQLSVGTEHQYFALGGSWVQVHAANHAYGSPGMAVLDFKTGKWTNESSLSTSADYGYATLGKGVFVPLFGEKGVIIFFGGYFSSDRNFTYWLRDSDTFLPFTKIVVYDIAIKKFTTQPASGDAPSGRWGFCAAGAQDKTSGGYDIFLFGGTYAGELNAQYEKSYAPIYVLSLPSFRWTKLPDSEQVGGEMRLGPTCHVVGGSQLIFIGGDDPTSDQYGLTHDPWPNAIGLFDMNTLKWKDSYNPLSTPYKRAPILIKTNKQPLAHRWASTALKQTFTTNPSGSNNSSGTNVGAIAGGVVAGFVVLALLIGITWWLVRRRRQRRKAAVREEDTGANHAGKPELDAVEPSVHVENRPYELENTHSPHGYGSAGQSDTLSELATYEQPQMLHSTYMKPSTPTQDYSSTKFTQNDTQRPQELPG